MNMFTYIKSKFLLTQAAAGLCRNRDKDRAQREEQLPQQHSVMSVQVKSAVSQLCLGRYEQAINVINRGMALSSSNDQEILALMELKNIIVRLRLKCESPDQLVGPTLHSSALPFSFSIEMLDVVQKVLRCRSHYEVLRISHHATYSEVKRAYKRLALRLHPDKNRSPGAEEAFRRINEAADTLTDNQKRIEYNMLTVVGDSFGGKTSLYEHAGDGLTPEDELDVAYSRDQELQQNRWHSYEPANQRMPQRQSLYQTEQLVIGLVAAMVFIMITLHYLATAPNYSFTPTSTYTLRLVSRNNHVTYFVKPELVVGQTEQQLMRLEQQVEEIYISDLKQSCKQELKLRDKLLQRARNNNNRKLRDHALKVPTPACHALVKLDEAKYKPLLLDNNSDLTKGWD